MADKRNILARLDGMIKGVGKTASVKTASPGGDLNSDNGTAAPQNGARMAENKSDAGKSTKAMIDGGAAVNPVNGAVTMNTDGAAAAAINGQSGATGGVLASKGEAPNQLGGSIKSASIAEQLRKAAGELEAPKAPAVPATPAAPVVPVTKTADVSALDTVRSILGKTASVKALNGLEKFVAKQVKSGAIKIAGDAGAPDPSAGAPAGMDDHAAASHGVDALIKDLKSGKINEEQAEQILVQALQDGSISKEDLAAAMQEMRAPGAPGDPAAAGAPTGDAGAPPAAADAGAPPVDPSADPSMGQKVAMLHIDESHPQYLNKLAICYPTEQELAGQACLDFAEYLMKSAAPGGELNTDNGTKKTEEAPGATKPPEDKGGIVPAVDNNVAARLPAAKGDISKSAGDAGAMPVAPPAPDAGAPPTDPSAGGAQDPMAAAGVAPQGADQEAALQAFMQQTGLTPESLMELLKTQAGAPSDPAMAKCAAYITKLAHLVAGKAAEFELAAPKTAAK